MLTTLLMFLVAILLSGIAGYYSVIGMTSIFSGAFIPILLMTGTLETSKVIVASWLYNNWNKTPFLLKSYLTAAVVILMFITSMGIFGFLSKAHIEQAAASEQQHAMVQRLSDQITEQQQIIDQAKKQISDVSTGSGGDLAVSARIDQANKLIESANQRVQPQIDEQQKIIDQENVKVDARVKDIQSQIDDIDKQVAGMDAMIQSLLSQNKNPQAKYQRELQIPDRNRLATQKASLLKQIDNVRKAPNPTVDTAKAAIAAIRAKVDVEVKQAHDTIDSLTAQLKQNVDTTKVQSEVDAQNTRIKAASDQLTQLTADKFKVETDSRKLEVEVGPIKYIAQMMYGDNTDDSMLERAVRYVILILIFVFDPLAVLMLIASNQGMAEWKAARAAKKAKKVADPVVDAPPVLSVAEPEPIVEEIPEPVKQKEPVSQTTENIYWPPPGDVQLPLIPTMFDFKIDVPPPPVSDDDMEESYNMLLKSMLRDPVLGPQVYPDDNIRQGVLDMITDSSEMDDSEEVGDFETDHIQQIIEPTKESDVNDIVPTSDEINLVDNTDQPLDNDSEIPLTVNMTDTIINTDVPPDSTKLGKIGSTIELLEKLRTAHAQRLIDANTPKN
jgi:hypothetical protein